MLSIEKSSTSSPRTLQEGHLVTAISETRSTVDLEEDYDEAWDEIVGELVEEEAGPPLLLLQSTISTGNLQDGGLVTPISDMTSTVGNGSTATPQDMYISHAFIPMVEPNKKGRPKGAKNKQKMAVPVPGMFITIVFFIFSSSIVQY